MWLVIMNGTPFPAALDGSGLECEDRGGTGAGGGVAEGWAAAGAGDVADARGGTDAGAVACGVGSV